LPWFFVDGFDFREAVCRDCAGGKEFVSLLCYGAFIVVAFVLAVVAWR
jgi:hypothetical protein